MRRIFKYVIPTDAPVIKIPQGAHILSVQVQDNKPCVWAEVDDDAPVAPMEFTLVPTGADIPTGKQKFLGTALLEQDTFVLHVYLKLP